MLPSTYAEARGTLPPIAMFDDRGSAAADGPRSVDVEMTTSDDVCSTQGHGCERPAMDASYVHLDRTAV